MKKVLYLLIALLLLAAGCDSAAVALPKTPSPPEAAPAVTAEPTPTPTPEPPPTPTPEPMPQGFIDLDDCTPEQKQEADRRIAAYLNAEGIFTLAELAKTGAYDSKNHSKPENFYLGTLDVPSGGAIIFIQEVLLFTAKLNGRFFLICGAEDKDRKRFINPVEIPANLLTDQSDDNNNYFSIFTQSGQIYIPMLSGPKWDAQVVTRNIEEIIEGCKGYLSKPVYFIVQARKLDPDDPSSGPKGFTVEANKRLVSARKFASSTYIPKYNKSKFVKYLKKFGKISGSVVTISRIDDMYEADLDQTLLTSTIIACKID